MKLCSELFAQKTITIQIKKKNHKYNTIYFRNNK